MGDPSARGARLLGLGGVAFVLGALAGADLGPFAAVLLAASVALGGICARRAHFGAGVSGLAAFFASGSLCAQLHPAPDETLGALMGPDLGRRRWVVEARVIEPTKPSSSGPRSLVALIGAAPGPVPGTLTPVRGRARLLVVGTEPCGAAGDRIRVWAKARRPTEARFFGGWSAAAHARRVGYALELIASSAEHCAVLETRGGGLGRALAGLRARMLAAIDARLSARRAAVVRALGVGDTSRFDEATRSAVRDAGLSHLFAVSGFHLGTLAWLALVAAGAGLRRWSWVSEGPGVGRVSALLALPLTGLYPALVGAPPSATRAGLMLATVLFARVLGRAADAWSALAAALMLMVALDPGSLSDPGLQLSFAAVAALLRLPGAIERGLGLHPEEWSHSRRFVWQAVLSTVAATLGTAPFVAAHFGRLSLVGLLANVPAALLAGAAVPLSLFGSLVSVAHPSSGGPLLDLAGLLAEGLLRLAEGAAAVPGGVVTLPPPTPWEWALFGLAMLGLAERGWRRWGALAALGLALSWAGGQVYRRLSTEARVTFLPVGQGDGAVLELPGGKVVVIDAGPGGRGSDAGERVLAPFLRQRRIAKIDLFIASHPHADHVGGLPGLMEAVPIERLWYSGDLRHGPREPLDILERRGEVVRAGARFEAGDAVLEVLAPSEAPSSYASVNDASVVVMLSLGEHRVLFSGDAEHDGEMRLVSQLPAEALRADVLKVGHHGSRSSSHDAFLERVRPTLAVICCETGNGFGFPHAEALERLGRAKCRLLRTDIGGAITVILDGEKIQAEAFAGTSASPSAARR